MTEASAPETLAYPTRVQPITDHRRRDDSTFRVEVLAPALGLVTMSSSSKQVLVRLLDALGSADRATIDALITGADGDDSHEPTVGVVSSALSWSDGPAARVSALSTHLTFAEVVEAVGRFIPQVAIASVPALRRPQEGSCVVLAVAL